MGDQIAEPLDIGHIGGRHAQHQGDAIGDVRSAALRASCTERITSRA